MGSLWASAVFLLASATDLLDGYMARKMDQITRLGKLLDPIADKLLVVSAVILLVASGPVPSILAILLIGREITITGLRAIAADYGVLISAEGLGKLKTFLQVVALTLLILDPVILDAHAVGLGILWLAVVMGLISGVQYFIRFAEGVRGRE